MSAGAAAGAGSRASYSPLSQGQVEGDRKELSERDLIVRLIAFSKANLSDHAVSRDLQLIPLESSGIIEWFCNCCRRSGALDYTYLKTVLHGIQPRTKNNPAITAAFNEAVRKYNRLVPSESQLAVLKEGEVKSAAAQESDVKKAAEIADYKVGKYTFNMLHKFYRNEGRDCHKRKLGDLWNLSNDVRAYPGKEGSHNYIQWMFPNIMESQFDDDAPCFTEKVYQDLAQDPLVIKNIKRSFDEILRFYGLKYENQAVVRRTKEDGDSFEQRSIELWSSWGFGHNLNRMTRILICLKEFGLYDEAIGFLTQLTAISEQNPRWVPQSSITFFNKVFG